MSEAKHTKYIRTPWKEEEGNIVDSKGEHILWAFGLECSETRRKIIIKHIVHRVNCHDELIEALKKAKEKLHVYTGLGGVRMEVIPLIEQALANAEEK